MNNALEQLQDCLNREIDLVHEFMTVLQAEANALTETAANDALTETTRQKNQLADQVAELAETRHGLLVQLGYSADKPGLDMAVVDHPQLQESCRHLYEMAQQASELNASNGMIVDTFLAHNQRALDTLRTLAGIGNLYDASGRTSPASTGSKTSIKAG